MKTNLKSMITLAAMTAATLSCSEKLEVEHTLDGNTGLVPVTLSVAGKTKSALDSDGKTVLWTAGDQIALFDDINGRVGKAFTVSDGKVDAEVSAGTTEIYAVYPYNASSHMSGKTLSTYIPTNQTAVAGSFGEEVNVAMAYTTMASKSLTFKNACALLKFHLDIADVISVTVTSNDETAMTGETAITFSGSSISGVTCSGRYSVTLSKEDGSALASGEDYYMAVAPRTYSSGVTMTIVKSDGSVLVRVGSSSLDLSLNGIKSLGTLTTAAFTACAGYYDAYVAGMPLEACGGLYKVDNHPAYYVSPSGAEKRLGNVINSGAGAYFLDSAVEFDDRALDINSAVTYILMGNNPIIKTSIVRPSGGKALQIGNGGSLIMKNLSLVATAGYFAMPTTTSPTTPFSKLHFDDCDFTIGNAIYYSSSDKGGNSIRVMNSRLLFTATGKKFYNASSMSNMSVFKEIIFSDNICYSSDSEYDIQLFNYNHTDQADAQTWSDCFVTITNNIIYGLTSSNGLVKHYELGGLTIGGNIYQMTDTGGKSYYIYSESQDNTLISNYGDVFYSSGSAAWVYSGFSQGQPAGVTNTLTSLGSTPFESFNTTTGAYILKDDYVGYGPRK